MKHLSICAGENQEKSPVTVVAPSPISEKKNTLRSPLRKVLSPINTNINQNLAQEFSFTEKPCDLFEPSTPKTSSFFTCRNIRSQKTATPLDKLNSRGSNLKVSA